MAVPSYFGEIDLVYFRTKDCLRETEKGGYGRCKFGNRCQYSHEKSWKRRCPYFLKYWMKERSLRYLPAYCPNSTFSLCTIDPMDPTSIIVEHLDKVCANGDECCYAHSSEEVLYHPCLYKTLPPGSSILKSCQRREECAEYYCPFYHNHAEIRPHLCYIMPLRPTFTENPAEMPWLPGVFPITNAVPSPPLLHIDKEPTTTYEEFRNILLRSKEDPLSVKESDVKCALLCMQMDHYIGMQVVCKKDYIPNAVDTVDLNSIFPVRESSACEIPSKTNYLNVIIGSLINLEFFAYYRGGPSETYLMYGNVASGPYKGESGWVEYYSLLHIRSPHQKSEKGVNHERTFEEDIGKDIAYIGKDEAYIGKDVAYNCLKPLSRRSSTASTVASTTSFNDSFNGKEVEDNLWMDDIEEGSMGVLLPVNRHKDTMDASRGVRAPISKILTSDNKTEKPPVPLLHSPRHTSRKKRVNIKRAAFRTYSSEDVIANMALSPLASFIDTPVFVPSNSNFEMEEQASSISCIKKEDKWEGNISASPEDDCTPTTLVGGLYLEDRDTLFKSCKKALYKFPYHEVNASTDIFDLDRIRYKVYNGYPCFSPLDMDEFYSPYSDIICTEGKDSDNERNGSSTTYKLTDIEDLPNRQVLGDVAENIRIGYGTYRRKANMTTVYNVTRIGTSFKINKDMFNEHL